MRKCRLKTDGPNTMLNTFLSPWPCFTQEEADAVSKVLLSNKVNYWTGSECREFEKEFAAFAGTRYAVALSNGTLALDVALKAIGIGAGDDVIVTSRTFLASASCIVNAGANPVFADVDLNSQNISQSRADTDYQSHHRRPPRRYARRNGRHHGLGKRT